MSSNKFVVIHINKNAYSVPEGLTLLSACVYAGFQIPRFCYDSRLPIAGNCRMCLVQIEGAPKPVASCALPITPNMSILLNSPIVEQARENALRYLLKNHPLDCAVCDQGGECDLQDQTSNFGSDRGQFSATKRASEDLGTHLLIKTNMTRCIHCTRCIRFAEDVLKMPVYGSTGRGEATLIGTFIDTKLHSSLSANVVDICPVGALTHRPLTTSYRSWELSPYPFFNIFNMEFNPITIFTQGDTIRRISSVGQTWLSNHNRYAFEGQYFNRPSPVFNPSFSIDQTFEGITLQIGPLVDHYTILFLAHHFLGHLTPRRLRTIHSIDLNLITSICIHHVNIENLAPNFFISLLDHAPHITFYYYDQYSNSSPYTNSPLAVNHITSDELADLPSDCLHIADLATPYNPNYLFLTNGPGETSALSVGLESFCRPFDCLLEPSKQLRIAIGAPQHSGRSHLTIDTHYSPGSTHFFPCASPYEHSSYVYATSNATIQTLTYFKTQSTTFLPTSIILHSLLPYILTHVTSTTLVPLPSRYVYTQSSLALHSPTLAHTNLL